MPPFTLLPLLAVFALFSLLAAGVLLVAAIGTPQLAAHLAFALGVMPLILAAMIYFVPVLTRSAAAGVAVRQLPLLAWVGGALAVRAFVEDFSAVGLGLAATCGGVAAVSLGAWAVGRIRRTMGSRHPGLDWYLAALGFLLLALLAVVLMPWFPQQRGALRLFHIHANLLGFVGLTALGTLQVLLPTCLGRPDPDAGLRLKRDLKWGVAGVLLIGTGASMAQSASLFGAGQLLALAGAASFGWVVLRMLFAWQSRFGITLLQVHGAAPALAVAGLGLLCVLAVGAMHGIGSIPARPAVAGYVFAFLLPLVTGAASHLLPVWLRPGVQGNWHRDLRASLCRWGGVRSLLLLAFGVLIATLS